MKEPRYQVRSYRPSDFTGYVRLHVDAERVDRAGHRTSMAALCEILGRPGHCPEEDVFVADEGGRVVGCVNLTRELGIGRVVLECLVHPEHRRRGLAGELCRAAELRAASLGAKVVQGCFVEGNDAAVGLASELGFRFVHRFLELELGLSRTALPDAAATGAGCRHLRIGEEATLTELQNRSFEGTWGYNPGTPEEIAYRLSLRDASPEGVVVMEEGEAPVGYCWTTVEPERGAAAGPSRGRIHMIGVLPGHRGRGLGRQTLMAGLAYLKGRAVEMADISVDSENTEACALYDSVGFTTRTTTEWYEKAVG